MGTVTSAQDLRSLEWIIGVWNRTDLKPGETGTESWSEISSNEFSGIGATLRGADTVFVEYLKLVLIESDVFYIADVEHNPEPTYFKITGTSPTGFICENPKHDFPKKIEYQLDGSSLIVTISGEGKAVPFRFEKQQ